MKTGFVSIIGKTNAGKSTLINQLVQSKISIATYKPQTTRNSIQGIYNDEEAQIVFIDTPGILKPHQKLDAFMNRQVFASMEGIDAIIFLVDAGEPYIENKEKYIQEKIGEVEVPLFIVFNKIDLTNVFLIENLKKKYLEVYPNAHIIEISALKDVNVDLLISEIKKCLPEGQPFYPDNIKSSHPVSFLIGEIVREKVLLCTQEEVPHCAAVKIEKIERKSDTTHIDATIIVEKNSQKGIIIGAQGKMIKKIGMKARKDIEKLLNRKVNLKTFVRVENNWRDSNNYLKEFGYNDKD